MIHKWQINRKRWPTPKEIHIKTTVRHYCQALEQLKILKLLTGTLTRGPGTALRVRSGRAPEGGMGQFNIVTNIHMTWQNPFWVFIEEKL